MKLLVEHGADVFLEDNEDKTALDVTPRYKTEVREYLTEVMYERRNPGFKRTVLTTTCASSCDDDEEEREDEEEDEDEEEE